MGFLIKVIFSEIFKEILKPLYMTLASKVGKDLWDTCVLVVGGVEVDHPDLEGWEKFKIVYDRVSQTMEAKGRGYSTSTKNLFIELAVAYIKKKLG